jgi:hypothetical protein
MNLRDGDRFQLLNQCALIKSTTKALGGDERTRKVVRVEAVHPRFTVEGNPTAWPCHQPRIAG